METLFLTPISASFSVLVNTEMCFPPRGKFCFYRLENMITTTRTTTTSATSIDDKTAPLSAKKLKRQESEIEPVADDDYYLIIHFPILKKLLSQVATFPDCDTGIDLEDQSKSQMGFAHKLTVGCRKCDFNYATYTSDEVTVPANEKIKTVSKGQGRKPFDVNMRMIICFREIGKCNLPLTTFAHIMNMDSMHVNTFDNLNEIISDAYKSAAELTMKDVA